MVGKLPLAAARERLPDPTGRFDALDEKDKEYLRELIAALTREFDRRPIQDEPVPYLLLFSPSGAAWKVTISDAGVLSGTVMWTP